jgi:hypothetical protein
VRRAIRPLIQPLQRRNAIPPLDLFRASPTQDVGALGQRKEVGRPLGKTFVGPDDKNAIISQVRLQVTQRAHLLRHVEVRECQISAEDEVEGARR